MNENKWFREMKNDENLEYAVIAIHMKLKCLWSEGAFSGGRGVEKRRAEEGIAENQTNDRATSERTGAYRQGGQHAGMPNRQHRTPG